MYGSVVFKAGDDGAAIHLMSIGFDARAEWIESPGRFLCADVEVVRDEDDFNGRQKQCVIEVVNWTDKLEGIKLTRNKHSRETREIYVGQKKVVNILIKAFICDQIYGNYI